jgi:hypothetical protein
LGPQDYVEPVPTLLIFSSSLVVGWFVHVSTIVNGTLRCDLEYE